MKKELSTKYNPKNMEERIYETWMDNNYFAPFMDESKESYSIIMPPPNVTGKLHMGHALDNTLQDILIRWKRMQGYNTLWLPGTDHASISTEVKVVDKMLKEGITKSDITREEFLERAWDWTREYGGTIVSQLKKLGASCDWNRQMFTLDEGPCKAVQKVFIDLYNKGYIYRGEKIINWCPHCRTTISDAEVDHEEKEGKFYHINYKLEDEDRYLEIATTRPETMLGDTGVAVNPKDERYKDLIGKNVILPILNKPIPIVGDKHADMEKGTGVVKITPAHDPNDFEVGERHNLPRINVMNDDGTMNEKAGKYRGMDRYECRKAILKDLENEGLLVKVEDHMHNVGTHERCKKVIEPMVKLQWFVKMDDMAKEAIKALKEKEISFVSEKYEKVYMNWLDNIRDWCISRQLWWGHRIPAYYCEECGEVIVSEKMPEKCLKCGCTKIHQDEDALDTWFSSALWPFSTMGWPDKTKDLEMFYPTNVIVTGYDIIFFWVIRMIFSGIEQTGEVPFKDIYMHGLVRDSNGIKMSKSLGNGIDPIEVLEKYGTDALRFMLVSNNTPGNDMRFYMEKVEASRNFANKVWNATRFIMMNIEDEDLSEKPNNLTSADKWILSKKNSLINEVNRNLEKYDLGIAAQKIQNFLWDEYCDWYVEMVKPRLYDKEDQTRNAALWTLKTVLIDGLKLLHPFMPFITEEIFTTIQDEEKTIMLSKWPEYKEELYLEKEENEVEILKEAVKGIRNLKVERNIAPSKKIEVTVVSEKEDVRNAFEQLEVMFKSLGNIEKLSIINRKEGTEDEIVVVIKNAILYLPLTGLINFEEEKIRLLKEQKNLEGEIDRIDKKLSNQGFVAKAPEAVVNAEKSKKENYKQMLEKVNNELEKLNKVL